MADNELFSVSANHSSFDNEGLEILPLITKERTQKFELLLHLIPNLKQHLIVSGASGIGKTLLLDQLYDLDSEVWQCCFVQGSTELSFETIEAQLTKTMQRNKHASLNSALQDFTEQHKKIVLIIDDAGLLVSGLMTALIDFAAAQPALKLIFSLTPEARNNHRKTDKNLDNCYLLEIPPLSKKQSAFFLRQLAAKPRTYGALQIDEKLVDKIYRDTNGIPAKIMAEFTKLSRQEKNDYTKWLASLAGVLILAILINQGVRHFNSEELPIEAEPILPVEKVESVEKTPIAPTTESKSEQDIVIPEFQLDIEKGITAAPTNSQPEKAPIEKPVELTPDTVVEPEKVEPQKPIEPAATPVVEPEKIEPEKPIEPIKPPLEPEKVLPPVVEKLPEPEKIIEPTIAFPKVEPAKGMKIQALPEKSTLEMMPIVAPVVKKVEIKPVAKIEIKPIEKPVEIKKPEPPKVEPVKKVEPKSTKEIAEVVTPQSTGRYTLQLISLSSQAAVEAFQKKHAELSKNIRVVKSGSEEKPRFGLVYGGFENAAEAEKAREKLPPEFANALSRKN